MPHHYAARGRTIAVGPWAGAGRDNPGKDLLVHGFYVTPQNPLDLIAFLKSLTGERVTREARWGDPSVGGRGGCLGRGGLGLWPRGSVLPEDRSPTGPAPVPRSAEISPEFRGWRFYR